MHRRRLKPTATPAAGAPAAVPPSVTVVPAGDDEKRCATVEPTVMFEEYDIKKDNVAAEHEVELGHDAAPLINCQSMLLTDDARSVCTPGARTPKYTVYEAEGASGSFVKTLKTLVDITVQGTQDDVRSLSSSSGESDSATPFSIIEPIRTTSYNIVRKSKNFIRNAVGREEAEERADSPGSPNAPRKGGPTMGTTQKGGPVAGKTGTGDPGKVETISRSPKNGEAENGSPNKSETKGNNPRRGDAWNLDRFSKWL